MKLEDQVCSLDLAKRLKELGVKQDSYFYWCKPWPLGTEWLDGGDEYKIVDGVSNNSSYSAFTVAELGLLIPSEFQSGRNGQEKWICWYGKTEQMQILTANTEADARANTLIYLVENAVSL